jgi:hypothetical protein
MVHDWDSIRSFPIFSQPDTSSYFPWELSSRPRPYKPKNTTKAQNKAKKGKRSNAKQARKNNR